MRRLLDPKNDVVFKLLFANEHDRTLLCSFLSAVLGRPVLDVEVLNPEIAKETISQKGSVLDVRARLHDGELTDVEMQALSRPGHWQRSLYYWGRLFTSQLPRGGNYAELARAIGVFILDFEGLPTDRYHSVFRVLEVHEHVPLTDELEIHVLELPKLPPRLAGPDLLPSQVLRWRQFFAAKTDAELEDIAMIDPEIRHAKTKLEELSADPKVQELARERELAAWNYERTLRLAREEGREEGQRALLSEQLAWKFGELPEPARLRLERATDDELARWAKQLLTASSLDDALS